MGTLYIITGISGSGKTTLGKYAAKELGVRLFSVDDYKVKYYHRYGFKTDTERLIVRKLAVVQFCKDIYNCCYKGHDLIVDYPFTQDWQEFFDLLKQTMGYFLFVINCNTLDFDTIWYRRIDRNSGSKRDISLMSRVYINKHSYVLNQLKVTPEYRELKRQEYLGEKYTSLLGDKIYTDIELKSYLKGGSLCRQSL